MAWWEIFTTPARDVLRPSIRAAVRRDPDVISLLQENDDSLVVRADREKGVSGTAVYHGLVERNEYNPLMVGDTFYNTIERMRKSDGDVKAALQICKLPMLRTTVQIVPADPKETDGKNKLIAETCQEKILGASSQMESWNSQLRNILLMFDFGFSAAERVWTVDDEGFTTLSRLAPRLSRTISNFKVNKNGTLDYIEQTAVKNDKLQTMKIDCPLYGTVFSWDREGDDYFGQSLLRVMYKHWFFKEELYRIDAVRLDRWGIGIPDAEVKEGYEMKPKEREDVKRILRDLRGNERAYILRPEEVKISILSPASAGGAIGLMDSVNHHSTMIFRSILGQFMAQGQSPFGNYGSSRNLTDLFLFSLQATANFIEEEYTRQVIKDFCDVNFEMVMPNGKRRPYPRLKFADVQRFDMTLISDTLQKFSSARMITPDDDLESFLRNIYGWPELPKKFTREYVRENPPVAPTDPNNPTDPDDPTRVVGRPTDPNAGKDRKVDQRPTP